MGCSCPIHNAEDFLSFPEDPTKTVGIRKRWIAQFNRRYRGLKGRVNRLLLKGIEGDIPVPFVDTGRLTANRFEFTSDAETVAQFMAWLQLQIDALLFTDGATPLNHWQNKFIDQAYIRGIKATTADLRRLSFPFIETQLSIPDIVGTAIPALGTGLGGVGTITSPIHLDAIRLLYTREFLALEGITQEMSKQIARVLVEGIEQGLGIREIAKNINDRIDKIGLTRSKLLARTETVRAYNISNINEFDALASELGIEAMFEWITARDGKVRPTHVRRDTKRTGRIYTKEEIIRLIGEPNCRCASRAHFSQEMLQAA
ncbi:hypothetical protein KAR91_68230 [Candidatus Pacearchaeota archaeon]|nr:hypothetical protein [Candidatus Pacearchaeota archaeon]